MFQSDPADPSNPTSLYTLSLLKGRKTLVKIVEDMYHDYELTGLYQEASQLFGIQPSKSFAKFLQALALHEYLVAQTFFKSL